MAGPEFVELEATLDGIKRKVSIDPSSIGCIVEVGNESLVYPKNLVPIFKVEEKPEEIIARLKT